MGALKDITGERFGKLVVLRRANDDEKKQYKGKSAQWYCVCDCGSHTIVQTGNLRSGTTTSCGCRQKEAASMRSMTHGKSKTTLYSIYANMKKRCYKSYRYDYKYYGGRGIEVCKEWLESFETFYKWALDNGYVDGLTLDRINPDENYCPENCRWVTIAEQQLNRRNNRRCTYNGETLTISQWARNVGIGEATIRHRLNNGWSVEDALTIKPKRRSSSSNDAIQ